MNRHIKKKQPRVPQEMKRPPSENRLMGAEGFTLVELLVALAISIFVIAGTTALFAQLFTQFKQESRVTQTDIGSAAGLEYLRKDIQSAGYGLPWDLNGAGYNEYAGADPNALSANDNGNAPRAVAPVNNAGQFGSDYLVIKSLSVPINDPAAGKSITLPSTGPTPFNSANAVPDPNPAGADWVIVLRYQLDSNNRLVPTLVTGGGAISIKYGMVNGSSFEPTDPKQTYMIYDVASKNVPATGLSMPFSRADYFITPNSGIIPASGCPAPPPVAVPSRCAPNTGELVKAVLRQDNGCFDYYPILDCVADMQVTFQLASPGNSIVDAGVVAGYSAVQIRQPVGGVGGIRGIRVYILAQEGQKDPSYTFPAAQDPIQVGDPGIGDLHQIASNNQQNYRWKIYTIVEKPFNLGAQ